MDIGQLSSKLDNIVLLVSIVLCYWKEMYLVLSAREYRWKHLGDIHILSINCVDIMLIEAICG